MTNTRGPSGWGVEMWQPLSAAVAWMLGALSLMLMLRGRGVEWNWVTTAGGVLALSCGASWVLRPVILDFLSDLQYKEKAALFLAHLVVLVSPLGVMGKGWLPIGLALVLLSLGLQLVTAVSFHRFLALCAVLVAMALWERPPGAIAWALGWAFLMGVFLIVARVRFSLEAVPGPALRVPPGSAARVILRYVAIPILAAGVCVWAWVPSPPARPLPQPGAQVPSGPQRIPRPRNQDVTRLMWESFALAVAISVAIGVLYWYSSVQSRKKARQMEIKEEIVKADIETPEPPEPAPQLDPLHGKQSRLEILRQFRRLERALARLDLGRRKHWTAREYLDHIAGMGAPPGEEAKTPESAPPAIEAVKESENTIVQVYEKARYALEDPAPGEVDAFRGAVGEVIEKSRKQSQSGEKKAP